MKFLAIDFGIKRVGFAVSSPDEVHSFPLCTYERTTRQALFDFILQTAEKEQAKGFVIGLPIRSDGTDSLTTSQVRNFTQSLKRRTELPIYLIDETLSSFDAEEHIQHLKADQRKKILDQVAAMCILSSFLSYNNKQALLV